MNLIRIMKIGKKKCIFPSHTYMYRYLYKYTESLKTAQMKDQADPTVMRSALTVRCRSARRPHYFLWNSFSITVS